MTKLSPEQWQQISPFLDEALALPEPERAAWLASLRSKDATLAHLLETLLADHKALKQERFLEQNPMLGTMLGPYQLLSPLGSGGMGEVYRARDTRLDRTVAIKVLPHRYSTDPIVRQRFEREAKAISALQHPNICTLYDIGSQNNTDYLVMEFLEGQTLASLLAQGALPTEKVLQYGIEVADALDSAQRRGVIHRDLKPANIFVTTRGECKVLDFGLAKFGSDKSLPETATSLAKSDQLTTPGMAMGTVAYMSPEQARGEILDARTDIFSLGAVLYEMATGKLAFPGQTWAVIFKAILDDTPPPPTESNPQIPGPLDDIVAKALEKDRDLRYQSAADLRADLQRLRRDSASNRRLATRRSSSNTRELLDTRDKKLPYRTIAVSTAAMFLVIGLLLFKTRWFRREPPKQQVVRDLTANTSDNPISAPLISPDGKQLVYGDQAKGLLLLQIDSGEKRSFPNAPVPSPSGWYPDGTHLLLSGPGAGGLWKMSTVDGGSRKLLDDQKGTLSALVSPDGSRIAFVKLGSPNEIWVMGSDGEDPRRVLSLDPSDRVWIFAIAWAPTSRRLLYTRVTEGLDRNEQTAIESCDLNGNQRTAILHDNALRSSDDASPLLWRFDGLVYFRLQESPPNATDSNIWSIDVDPETGHTTGSPSRVTTLTGWEQTDFSQSADGKRIVFRKMQEKYTIQVAETKNANAMAAPPRPLGGDDWDKWDMGWTNDSHALVFVSDPQGRRGIFQQNVQTHETRTLVSGPDRYLRPEVTPDGQWLLFTRASRGDSSERSMRLMRMPFGGGSASVVLSGEFEYACASKAGVCVLSEITNNQLVFSLLDPLKGRGPILAHVNAEPEREMWSISSDGKKIAVLSGVNSNLIQILNADRQGSSTTKLDGWLLQTVSWSPDNQHLYVTGISGQSFKIGLAGLDGKVKVMMEVPTVLGWPSHLRPSPDGRYFAYQFRTYGGNVVLLENP